MSGLRVGVVGATGQVGAVMRQILAERKFPIADIRNNQEFGPELAQLGLELRAQDGFILGNDGSDTHR